MRAKHVYQRGLDFSKSHLKITNEYYARYDAVSSVLDQAPELLDLIHRDLKKTLKSVNREGRGRLPSPAEAARSVETPALPLTLVPHPRSILVSSTPREVRTIAIIPCRFRNPDVPRPCRP